MKVLHIYDTAGSSSIIAKYQKRMYEKVHVVTMKRLDKFGISEFYNAELFDGTPLQFYLHVAKLAMSYDVLHVHSLFGCVKWLKLLYPLKKIILQYHGSDLRTTPYNWSKTSAELACSKIFLSTPDLKHYCHSDSVVVGNPIDTEHFKPTDTKTMEWLAFYESGKWDTSRDNNGYFVRYVDRNKIQFKYGNMPYIYNHYSGFIDVKIMNGKRLEAMSKSGLEALSCGLKVKRYDNQIVTEFPKEYQPQHVADIMDRYYQ